MSGSTARAAAFSRICRWIPATTTAHHSRRALRASCGSGQRRPGRGPPRGARCSGCGRTDGCTRAPGIEAATGDIGSVDAEGWLRVVGRKKLVIVRGGANVYPAEVERILTACPGVAAAAVFGVPDERLGERVAALVEPLEPGVELDELRRGLRTGTGPVQGA